ncbi:dehydrodolichyl diphosphate synthase complex subunit nus1-like [Paramacrobiotus metropolitanus]|uniref:dehydrodolichyl diphosphate synthase complex subunit nus1-like n=1 Tax=Paramacrobiotus metropolitanus TaxID=2943436 RepID=UPI00244648D2|nr:dehydrodolichyl diphosphate synthase complex subunit nus1-like [Paramacrobiotus metropolitanus]
MVVISILLTPGPSFNSVMLKSLYYLQLSMGIFSPLRSAVLLLLWQLLHLLISAYTFTVSIIWRWRHARHTIHPADYADTARRDRQCLSKIPVHLGIVFAATPSRFPLENLLELVTWSAAFGVAYVSVYDAQGVWMSRVREVRSRLMQEVPASQFLLRDGVRKNGVKKPVAVDEKMINFNGVNVIFLSESDGKSNIAKCAEDVCRDVLNGTLSTEDIDQNVLQSYISDKQPFPDPELILKIGRTNSLAGYLPWHVRLSEIIYCPRWDSVSFQEFRWALYRYSRVEQRIGR